MLKVDRNANQNQTMYDVHTFVLILIQKNNFVLKTVCGGVVKK